MSFPKTERILFFLVILFISTQLGKHFWPDFSYLYSLKVDYFSPVIYFWDLLLVALIVIWVKNKPLLNKQAILVFFIFILSQEISLFSAENLGAGLVRLEQLILIGFLGIYLASKKINDYIDILRRSLVITLIFQGLLSIGQILIGKSFGFWVLGERTFTMSTPTIAKFNWFGQIILRPYGTFSHPNVLAGFMVVLLPLIVFLNSSYKKKYEIFIMILSIILSFSRTAILALIIGGLVVFKKNIMVVFIILILLAPILMVRFNSIFNFDNLSLVRREQLNLVAISDFNKSPFFGVGLNNFINNMAKSNIIAGPVRFLQPVHNILLLTLSETGVVGLAGLIILMGFPIIRLWRNKASSYCMVLFYCWVVIIFLGMFDHYFLTIPQGQRLFFLIWGLSLARL